MGADVPLLIATSIIKGVMFLQLMTPHCHMETEDQSYNTHTQHALWPDTIHFNMSTSHFEALLQWPSAPPKLSALSPQ